jgi:hypothetical protein
MTTLKMQLTQARLPLNNLQPSLYVRQATTFLPCGLSSPFAPLHETSATVSRKDTKSPRKAQRWN